MTVRTRQAAQLAGSAWVQPDHVPGNAALESGRRAERHHSFLKRQVGARLPTPAVLGWCAVTAVGTGADGQTSTRCLGTIPPSRRPGLLLVWPGLQTTRNVYSKQGLWLTSPSKPHLWRHRRYLQVHAQELLIQARICKPSDGCLLVADTSL